METAIQAAQPAMETPQPTAYPVESGHISIYPHVYNRVLTQPITTAVHGNATIALLTVLCAMLHNV